MTVRPAVVHTDVGYVRPAVVSTYGGLGDKRAEGETDCVRCQRFSRDGLQPKAGAYDDLG